MFNVCRCCLTADGCTRDIFNENQSAERPEVYGYMLKDTLNIEISQRESHVKGNTLICDVCVSRIQEASAFKAMVLQSEEAFEIFLKKTSLIDNLEIIKQEVIHSYEDSFSVDDDNLEKIKQEVIHSDEDRFSMDDEPQDVLQNMKDSVHSQVENKAEIQENQGTRTKRKIKKIKKISNEGDTKSNDDWSKLRELRGDGPLLRENSLKLLENSTIFAFQWHRSKYRCFCCQKPFLNIDELRNHSIEHKLKDLEKKIIKTQNHLVKVEVSVMKCKLCCNILADLQELRSHLSTDHNFEFRIKEDLLIPFKIREDLECQICNEQFSNFRLLNIHMNRHFQKHVCHVCGAAFSNLRFLTLHRSRVHRLWKCKDCNIEFSSRIEKKQHDLAIHNIKLPTKTRFPCPYCDERYYQENFKIKHLIEKHGMKKPEHKCGLCPKTFITKTLCNNHFKTVHRKERKHSCDICNYMFYTKSDLSRHHITHTGEKKHKCGLCNAPFASKDSLRRHMRRTHANAQITEEKK